tara:strand:+ start:24652 stop:25128 length:477 start_codon:yes stop_codon:yes gene_type:complete
MALGKDTRSGDRSEMVVRIVQRLTKEHLFQSCIDVLGSGCGQHIAGGIESGNLVIAHSGQQLTHDTGTGASIKDRLSARRDVARQHRGHHRRMGITDVFHMGFVFFGPVVVALGKLLDSSGLIRLVQLTDISIIFRFSHVSYPLAQLAPTFDFRSVWR